MKMSLKNVYETFKQWDNSWRGYHVDHKDQLIHWKDWNGKEHVASSIEELKAQLRRAPLCQTEKQSN